MRLLLTWSDRALEDAPPSSGRRRVSAPGRNAGDRGPVMRFLEQKESRGAHDAAWILTTPSHQASAERLLADVRRFVPEVRLRVVPIEDPSDHELLFHALMPIVREVPVGAEVTTLLSAGTPQAQTLWVVLVKSGLLDARMVQVIPPRFVPHPHPRAIREVTLDFAGFPEIRALREEVVQLRAEQRAQGGLVGDSPPMSALIRRLGRVASAPVPVLILGETGTGKELVARALHEASPRAAGPFLAENCGALSEGTLESELFGHERGAFTGAVERRRGLFELAHGGTLFLDELGEMGAKVQVRLLRVLETGTLRRVGGESEVRVDVRVVAATHRDLGRMIREGQFREDLYYRLKGGVLELPALRERSSDLEPLVVHFLGQLGGAHLRPTRAAWRALQSYPWPGNVRELRAEVARWVVFSEGPVTVEDLSPEIRAYAREGLGAPPAQVAAELIPSRARSKAARPLSEIVAEVERRVIDEALARNEGNLSKTARELSIDRNTLKRKLGRRAGLDVG